MSILSVRLSKSDMAIVREINMMVRGGMTKTEAVKELLRRGSVAPDKLDLILARFDEVQLAIIDEIKTAHLK